MTAFSDILDEEYLNESERTPIISPHLDKRIRVLAMVSVVLAVTLFLFLVVLLAIFAKKGDFTHQTSFLVGLFSLIPDIFLLLKISQYSRKYLKGARNTSTLTSIFHYTIYFWFCAFIGEIAFFVWIYPELK